MECEKELASFIRAGVLRRPTQAVGHYFEGTRASCALGAAYEGMYRLPSETGPANPSRDLEWFFACLDSVKRCPAENCKKKLSLAALIVHLNDDHRWSREQIADWVSGQQIASPERALPNRAAEEAKLAENRTNAEPTKNTEE
jgi:hypothetical protein